ncbi:hypothetical protein DPMN_071783 [Dreissena polymorpha]|uniref:Uncharacterized protein n=1 Tax=Dreissena polymorpha TaxID=45954 RepID=A0A9D3Z567_DREPO|nr:hypothetical protein DPMN_071783 [Dreissena polymorpha]
MCVIGKDSVTMTGTAPLNLDSTYLQLTGSSCSHCSLDAMNKLKIKKLQLQIKLYEAQLANLQEE